jgi:hypothetical protein
MMEKKGCMSWQSMASEADFEASAAKIRDCLTPIRQATSGPIIALRLSPQHLKLSCGTLKPVSPLTIADSLLTI